MFAAYPRVNTYFAKSVNAAAWLAHKLSMPPRHGLIAILQLVVVLALSWGVTVAFYFVANWCLLKLDATYPAYSEFTRLTPAPSTPLNNAELVRIPNGVALRYPDAKGNELFQLQCLFRPGRSLAVVCTNFNRGELFLVHAKPEWRIFATTYTLQMQLTKAAMLALFDSAVEYQKNRDPKPDLPQKDKQEAAKKLFATFLSQDLKLDSLPHDMYWARVINGPVQFTTVWCFVAFVVLIASRAWVYVRWERRDRDALWLNAAKVGKLQNDLLHPERASASSKSALVAARKCLLTKIDAQEKSMRAIGGITFPKWLRMPSFVIRHKVHDLLRAFLEKSDSNNPSDDAISAIEHERVCLEDASYIGYFLPRYFIWAIPTLGFVGTIVGIGNAMIATGGVSSQDKFEQALARSAVTAEIGVAFDTTLVALLLSIIATLAIYMVERAESEQLMEAHKITTRLAAWRDIREG